MQRFESSAFQAHISCPRTDVQLVRHGAVLTVSLSYRGAYGMGEKYDALNQKGHVVVNQVEEKFCFQGEKTYCPTPFFWTDSGFGLYVDTCETTTFHFDENSVTIDLPESAPVVAFSGEPAQIVSAYMELFGKAVLPRRRAADREPEKARFPGQYSGVGGMERRSDVLYLERGEIPTETRRSCAPI